MSSRKPAPSRDKPKRRTQAERTAATRAALLDATIECVVDEGYAETTTTKIAERAGVSRGAQVHHFPTKSELVAEAVKYLARRRLFEIRAELAKVRERDVEHPDAEFLELFWRMHTESIYAASIDLFVAARTDATLRPHLAGVEREVGRAVHEAAVAYFEDADPEPLREWVDLCLATMSGLALLAVVEKKGRNRRWRRIKAQLLQLGRAQGIGRS